MSGAASGAVLRGVLDYLLNCAWQAPLVALAAVALTQATRPSLRDRCLAFAGALVLLGVAPLVPVHLVAGLGAATSRAPVAATLSSADPTPSMLAPVPPLAAEGLVLAAGLAVCVAAIRLAVGWTAARRLVRRSTLVRLPQAAVQAMRDFLASSGRRIPDVRTSRGLSGPAVVGAWAPVVLVPPGFEALPEEQLAAALLHECAHVARRDYALNLLCETLALPSSWHPAAVLLKRRLRAAREAACDQLAATALGSPTRYARCLVELARTVQGGPRLSGPALQLLGRGELEDRVRRLTGPRSGGARPLQSGAAVALALGCIAPLTCLHLTPVLRDGRMTREVARVAVFDRTAPPAHAPPAPLAVASLSASAAPSPRPTRTTRRGAVARLRLRAPVQLALAEMAPTPLASAAQAPPATPPAVVEPPVPVAPPTLALTRLDEVGDIGRIVFAIEIGAVSPCLAPPAQAAAANAGRPPARSTTNPAAAFDFDPFAPTVSTAETKAPAPPTATPATVVAPPACLKAAVLQAVRPRGLA